MAKGSVSPRSLSQRTSSLLLFAVSGFLAVVGMALGIEIKKIADTRQPLFNTIAAICGPHTMGQSFVATAPNLSQIDLWLAWSPPQQSIELTPTVAPVPPAAPASTIHTDKDLKYRLFLPILMRSPDELRFSTVNYPLNAEGCDLSSRSDDGAIVVSLKQDPTASEVIASGTLRLDSVEDPAKALRRPYVYRSFAFPSIPDSAGRTFYLSIEAPDSSALAPLLARYHYSDVYADGTRYLDGASTEGDLAFRVHYSTAPMSNSQLLLHRLTHNRPIPFNWPWLYPLLLATYAGSVALVIKAVVQKFIHTED